MKACNTYLTPEGQQTVVHYIGELQEEAFDTLISDDENFRNTPNGRSDQGRRED